MFDESDRYVQAIRYAEIARRLFKKGFA